MLVPAKTPRLDPQPEAIGQLRADLAAANFTVDGIAALLGPMASAALHREQRVPAERATRGHEDRLATLIRLFTLGTIETHADLDRALPTLTAPGAEQLGLIAPDGDAWRATYDLRPYSDDGHDWLVVSDLSEVATGHALTPDHVLGIGGASLTLSSWTIRRPVATALDLGTGCGVQALHLAEHVDHIVATDLSSRALTIAAFNAALNDQDWELRSGDLLEPVAGQRFDLIVSNPPFVITPRRADVPTFEYRDGGRSGDRVVQSIVRSVGEHLKPGGVAQFLGNWEVPRGSNWRAVWEQWLEGSDLDALVVQREVQDPAQYAELWIRDGGIRPGEASYDSLYAAWLADFEARDVESIGFGIVTVQRPDSDRAPWRELTEVLGPVATPMGPVVERALAARNWLAEVDDETLLDTVWLAAPDVTTQQNFRVGDGDPVVIEVRQGGGLGRRELVSAELAAYLSVCDGSLSARAAIPAIAQLAEVSEERVRGEVLPAIRRWVADGILRPAS